MVQIRWTKERSSSTFRDRSNLDCTGGTPLGPSNLYQRLPDPTSAEGAVLTTTSHGDFRPLAYRTFRFTPLGLPFYLKQLVIQRLWSFLLAFYRNTCTNFVLLKVYPLTRARLAASEKQRILQNTPDRSSLECPHSILVRHARTDMRFPEHSSANERTDAASQASENSNVGLQLCLALRDGGT